MFNHDKTLNRNLNFTIGYLGIYKFPTVVFIQGSTFLFPKRRLRPFTIDPSKWHYNNQPLTIDDLPDEHFEGSELKIFDVNRDGYDEIVIVNDILFTWYSMRDFNGTYPYEECSSCTRVDLQLPDLSDHGSVRGISFGHVDNDNEIDFTFIAGNKLYLALNPFLPSHFTIELVSGELLSPMDTQLVDIDNEGLLDLFVASNSTTNVVTWFRNRSRGPSSSTPLSIFSDFETILPCLEPVATHALGISFANLSGRANLDMIVLFEDPRRDRERVPYFRRFDVDRWLHKRAFEYWMLCDFLLSKQYQKTSPSKKIKQACSYRNVYI